MSIIRRLAVVFGIIMSASLLFACSGTKLNYQHSLAQTDLSLPYATVYFIRPLTEHPQGVSDNVLTIEVDDEKIAELAKGEYTLFYLKPRPVNVTLRNLAQTRGRWEIEEMARSRSFRLEAGETYFIHTKMINGEFRGVRFIPEVVSEDEAKRLADHLRVVGKAAEAPISRL